MKIRRDVFQAIADPTRRAILILLASQNLTAGVIASSFDSARPTVSKHLHILEECKLVTKVKTGREIYYKLNSNNLKEVEDFTENFRKFWDDKFNKLESVMKKYKQKRK